MSAVARIAVVTALFMIGKRWKHKTLGLTVALLWLVLPMGTPSIAAALFLWAFVFLQRAPWPVSSSDVPSPAIGGCVFCCRCGWATSEERHA
jgi:hypothetical protein